jgi:hypothetical protein
MTTATVTLGAFELAPKIELGNDATAGAEAGDGEDVWQASRLLRGLGHSMVTAALLGCSGLFMHTWRGASQEVPTLPSVAQLAYAGSASLVHSAAVTVDQVAFTSPDLRLIPFEEPLGAAMSHAGLATAYARHSAVPPEPEDLFELPDFLR